MKPRPSSPSSLDWLVLISAFALCAGAIFFRFSLWPSVGALVTESPADFAVAFARHRERARLVMFPLGGATAMLTLIVLIREGVRGSLRGRLRIAAVLGLLASTLVGVGAAEPIERLMLDPTAGVSSDSLRLLVGRWLNWQRFLLGLTVLVGVTLAVAHRAPIPREDSSDEGEGLTARHRRLLFLLGAATLFEGYDRFIVSLALPYIGRDLGADEGELGWSLSAIRIGALASIALGRLADRHGRRRLLLITILAYTVATAATGLSRGIVDFVVYQLLATIFLVSELALAQVVIAEEFPPALRGRGQGLLGAFAALGAGVAVILFPLFQASALGWRGLYLVGLLPLMLIAYFRRSLPETEHWQRSRTDHGQTESRLIDLLRQPFRLRFLVLVTLAFCLTAAGGSAGGFVSYRAINGLGWTPSDVSAMFLTAGGVGFTGWFLFGRLADVLGRRLSGTVAFIGLAVAIAVFYRTRYLFPAMATLVFMEGGVQIAINSLGTELFPTRLRATAKSWITSASMVGAMSGLAMVGALAERLGGAEVVISFLALLPGLAAPALYLLPETTGRRLEDIVGEDHPPRARAVAG